MTVPTGQTPVGTDRKNPKVYAVPNGTGRLRKSTFYQEVVPLGQNQFEYSTELLINFHNPFPRFYVPSGTAYR